MVRHDAEITRTKVAVAILLQKDCRVVRPKGTPLCFASQENNIPGLDITLVVSLLWGKKRRRIL